MTRGSFSDIRVAHALVRAVSALVPTPGLVPGPRVHKSVDAARKSACATIAFFLLLQSLAWADIVTDVRTALAANNFALAESEVRAYRARAGASPEMVDALSWLARYALARGSYDQADAYAAECRKLAAELLKKRPLDAEPHLPLALGAAIEVQAQVLAARGQRAEAVAFLDRELAQWRASSLRTRIQKNINLLSLEGKPAPALNETHWLGPQPQPLAALRGHPVLLFFWAHWCPDCKQKAPEIAQLETAYRAKGLVVIAPTQHYGYVGRGQEAGPVQELRYIEQVRQQYYASLADVPVPVSQENFRVYGASTTPTLVLIDGKGIVRMYHPGAMPYAELAAQVEAVVRR